MNEPNQKDVPAEQSLSFQELSFRIAVLPLLAFVVGFGLAIGLSLALLHETTGRQRVNPVALVVAVGAGEAMGLLGTLLVAFAYQTYAGPAGIGGFTVWSEYRQVPWDTIVAVKPFNFFGLKYLRVFAANQYRPLWLPLFLSERAAFEDAVHSWGGLENPLARTLRKAQDDSAPCREK